MASLPKARDAWLEIETTHFTFYGNSSRAMMQRFARDLEQLHAALGQFSRLELGASLPTHVYVFFKDSRFEPYKPLYNGRTRDVAGYFLGTPDGNFIALNGDPAADPTAVVYHEYVHHVLASNYRRLPTWLDEGIAEYFSTFQINRGPAGRHRAEVGRAIPEHVLWLRRNSLIPLPELFSIGVDSPVYNEGRRRGVFYAQSWALVHYLMLGRPERLPQLTRFLNLSDGGRDRDAAFTEAFGVTPEALEKELLAYVRGSHFPMSRVAIEPLPASAVEPRSMGRHEVLYRLGDLLSHQRGREREAEAHFRAALELEPAHAPSLAGLAQTAEVGGRLAAARALYERSLAADPAQPRVLFRYAEALLAADDDAATRREARRALERAVELEPGFEAPWASLVFLYTFEPTPDQSVVARAERARALLPTRADVAFNLLAIYGAAGHLDSARTLVEEFFVPLRDPELLERARRILRTVEHNRFVEQYNVVIRLFNSMRYREAGQVLEKLLASLAPESREAAEARQLLESIRAEIERRGG